MASNKTSYLALDVGEKRIGVAVASGAVKIAVPLTTVQVDGTELKELARIVASESTDVIVVGYPRNQSGEATAQTAYAENFAAQLDGFAPTLVFQDESLTSVMAENQLKALGGAYKKEDIDARAAAIILQDYLEMYT